MYLIFYLCKYTNIWHKFYINTDMFSKHCTMHLLLCDCLVVNTRSPGCKIIIWGFCYIFLDLLKENVIYLYILNTKSWVLYAIAGSVDRWFCVINLLHYTRRMDGERLSCWTVRISYILSSLSSVKERDRQIHIYNIYIGMLYYKCACTPM